MARGRVFQKERGRGRPWSYVVDAEPGLDGRRLQRKRGGFATRADAERALRAYLSDRDAGRPTAARSDRRVGEWLAEWLETKAASVKPTTLNGYRYAVEQLITPRVGGLKLRELRPVHLQRLYTTLSQAKTDGGAGLSPRSVRLAHQVLRPALQHAADLGLIAVNPAASRLVLPRIVRREMTVWSPEDTRRFLDATAEDRLGALWRLILTTGLRRGEALGLRWADVDLRAGSAWVSQNLVVVKGKVQISTPKGEPRRVSLASGTVAALRAHRARQRREQLLCGPGWTDSGQIFTTAIGTRLDPNNVYDEFRDACRKAGVPVIRLHDGRHTAATLALQGGAHPKLVQEMLGHASIEMTLDTYSHVVPGMHREVADRIEKVLAGADENGEAPVIEGPTERQPGA
jgi:integrase